MTNHEDTTNLRLNVQITHPTIRIFIANSKKVQVGRET